MTWNGRLPVSGETLYITRPILLDIESPELKAVYISGDGSLVFAHRDRVSLSSSAVLIYNGGALVIGSNTCRYEYQTSITLIGSTIYTVTNHTIDGQSFGQKVIGVGRGGTLELYGALSSPAWTRLATTLFSKSQSGFGINPIITLTDSVEWQAGDRIVLASTDYDEGQSEEMNLIECPMCLSNQVRLQGVPKYMHWTRGEVALISRNILIQGRLESVGCNFNPTVCQFFPHDTFGGHVMIMNGFTNAHIEGVELFHMGQPHMLSRYPIHFHMAGHVDEFGGHSPRAHVANCSVHHSYSRCYVIHGTHGLTVYNNVAYDTVGHCFMLCDGIESRNVFTHNLGLLTRPGLLMPSDRNCEMCSAVQPLDYNGDPTQCNECNAVSTFWISNPNNTLVGNVAGGSSAVGIWYIFPDYPLGESSADGHVQNVRPPYIPVTLFRDNVVHSNRDGLLVDNALKTSIPSKFAPQQLGAVIGGRYKPRTDSRNPNSAPAVSTFTGLVSYKNRWRGAWARGGNLVFDRCIFSDNAIGMTLSSEGDMPADPGATQTLSNSVFIGESDNYGQSSTDPWIPKFRGRTNPFGENGNMPIRGFEIYDGTCKIENITFQSFITDNSSRNITAIGWYRFNDWQVSPKTYLKNIRFQDVSVPFRMESTLVDGDKTQTIYDLDGSATGEKGSVLNTRYYGREASVTIIRDEDEDNALTMLGIPNYTPRRHFLPLVLRDHSYSVHFENHPVPPILHLQAVNWDQYDTMDVALCVGIYSVQAINVTKMIGLDTTQRRLEPTKALVFVDATNYFHDLTTGLLHLKLVQDSERVGSMYCPNAGCEQIQVSLSLTSSGKETADCRSAFSTSLLLFGERLHKLFKDVSSPTMNTEGSGDVRAHQGLRYIWYTPLSSKPLVFQCKQPGCIPATGIKRIEFWINAGTKSEGQLINISLFGPFRMLAQIEIDRTRLIKDSWTLVRIPFADLVRQLPRNTPFDGIYFFGGYSTPQNPIAIDDIKLVYDA
eukprot:gene15903-18898_t